MSPVNCLCFNSRIPPGIKYKNIIGFREIQAEASSFKRNKENLEFFLFLKAGNLFLSVFSTTIQISEIYPFGFQIGFKDS